MARWWSLPTRPEREELGASPSVGASRAIYGTLLAASVIVAWDDDVVEGLALAIVVTGVVFALVHVYADWLAAHAASP
jgi:membrane associated rhomboid family serine protease